MAVDILSVNALHRKTANNRKERKVQLALRDSAIAAHAQTGQYIDSWNTVIQGLDSDITNFTVDTSTYDCFHAAWNSNDHYDYGHFAAMRYGIKRLCHFGSITGHFGVYNDGGSWGVCGSNCTFTVPAGVSRMHVVGTAPGGPSKMVNCCGNTNTGPYGSFLAATFCVTPGEIYCFCAGCACCCQPYCCGYDLYTSCPSTMCKHNNYMAICLRSPNPYACVEMKNRGWGRVMRDQPGCAGSANYVGNLCYSSCGNCPGGCCCINMWWMTYCMCGQCGTSVCQDGNNWGCMLYGCEQSQYGNRCLSGWDFQRDLYGYNGNCACSNQVADCCQAVHICSTFRNSLVPNSCFPWYGGWTGGWTCNNCIANYAPNHPYALAVGLTTADISCNMCWTNHCCGYYYRAECQIRCFPGYGGSPALACGGYNNIYSDPGRRGAWCVQYC